MADGLRLLFKLGDEVHLNTAMAFKYPSKHHCDNTYSESLSAGAKKNLRFLSYFKRLNHLKYKRLWHQYPKASANIF
jgi:hypothetical protein